MFKIEYGDNVTMTRGCWMTGLGTNDFSNKKKQISVRTCVFVCATQNVVDAHPIVRTPKQTNPRETKR